MLYKLKKGLDIPLRGRPDQRIEVAGDVKTVAVLGDDYIGLKPTMLIKEGDSVKEGTPLFEDKKNPGVVITSPASGIVEEINRGAKRSLVSVVIKIQGNDAVKFATLDAEKMSKLTADKVRQTLQKSGLWSSFRTRPYGKIPAVESTPSSVFINAMDTNPLALDPQLIIKEHQSEFTAGVSILSKLEVPLHVCQDVNARLPDLGSTSASISKFSGPHPAGLSSTHIHFIDPVSSDKTVWTIGYQDVIAIGSLFSNGRIDTKRYVSLAGPLVNSPRIFLTRCGANVDDLVTNRLIEGNARLISGSVFNGHHAIGHAAYLGRYDNQVSVIEESTQREFMGWIVPGKNKFSALNVFVSSILGPRAYKINSSQNGSPRAIVPIGVFEKIMPLDILPTPLVKSILVKDSDSAQELGCLELVEEDLSLCSFVDPSKHDFAPLLRETLNLIEREG